MKSDIALEVRNLYFKYERDWILEDVNLVVRERDFLAILGPNGSGKTTLLKLMLGILKPNKGEILIYGRPPKHAWDLIGYMPQNFALPFHIPLRVIDVVLMGRIKAHRNGGIYTKEDYRDAEDVLEKMRISGLKNELINSLSQGQKQRVLIARALASKPKILFLDEPTSNIDQNGKVGLFELLKELNREITIIVITHDIGVISNYFNSIACVNKRLYYNPTSQIPRDMIISAYGGTVSQSCNLSLLTHGDPHFISRLE